MFKKLMFITLLLLTTNANAAKQYYYFNKLPNLIKASCDGSPFTCSGGESGGETPGEEVDLSKLSISVSSELMLEKDSDSKALPVSLSISDGDISGVTLSVVKKEDISSIISAVSVSDNDGSDREISVSKASGGVLGRATITITATSGSTSKSVDVSVFTAGNCPLAKSIDTIDRQIYCDSDNNYLISSAEDLMYISEKQSHSSVGSKILSGDYKLTDNISLSSSYNFAPIGTSSTPFTGTFNGDGHSISGLTVNESSDFTGMFGYSYHTSTIKNLAIKNANISGKNYVGILSGYNRAKTENIYTTGSVSGASYVGGISGWQYSNYISYSYSEANISGTDSVGGLVGFIYYSTIIDSYASFTTAPTGNSNVGGLVGYSSSGNVNNYSDLCEEGVNACSEADALILQTSWDYDVWSFEENSNLKFKNETDSGVNIACNTNNPLDAISKEGDIYLISNVNDFKCIFDNQNRDSNILSSKYKLTTNLDMSSVKVWRPIGTEGAPFTGIFDGDGRSISGLTVNTTGDYAGLFGYSQHTSTIKNLAIKNANISGKDYVGILSGYNRAKTENIYTTGSVSGASYVGGISGWQYSNYISYSYSEANISGTDSVGGLVGFIYYSTIIDSYASFTTAPTGNSNVGGLVGYSSSGNVNNYSDLCEEGVNACSEADAIAIQNNSWTSPIWKTVGTTKTPLLIKE